MCQLLIVDDEYSVVESLARTIDWNKHGIDAVYEATSGKQALELLQSRPIDIVISDIRMPGIDGLELITEIGSRWEGTKCILLSGYADFEYARQAIRTGVEDYLLKPVSHETVIESVCRARESVDRDRRGVAAWQQRPEEPSASACLTLDRTSVEPEGESKNQAAVVRRVQQFVQQRLAGDVSLQTIAAEVYLHPVYLSRLYKQETGEALSDYLLRLRMEQASSRLRSGNERIHVIAASLGYRNAAYFIRVFKRYFGTTPQEYRDQ